MLNQETFSTNGMIQEAYKKRVCNDWGINCSRGSLAITVHLQQKSQSLQVNDNNVFAGK